jgi:two-component system OmpR family sensor kinase
VPGLRSLRNRLALIFALIIAGAIGTIYLSVTPRLEASLTSQRLNALIADSKRYTPIVAEVVPLEDNNPLTARPDASRSELKQVEKENANRATRAKRNKTKRDGAARRASDASGAQVIVYKVADAGPFAVANSKVSGGLTSSDVLGLARQAIRTRRQVTETGPTRLGRQAIVVQPTFSDDKQPKVTGAAVFADSLSDVQDNVALIRRQVLISGAIALVIAVLAGYLVARALAARVKRLERAARKVASGDFSQPIRSDSDDELGQLAAAFDDMQNQLARLDRARKQFIASASHELRTPIFSLGGFLELLADEDLDEETRRQFLDQIRGQVDRMRNLSVELLDLSRLEAGALELRPEPTDVGQLAREVAAEFTPAAARHDSEVTLDLRPEPIELDCDPERVAQVLRILLDNALRHTPPGTGVRVSAARANGHVRLEVSDRGLGIKRQNMPHIFEPFFTSNEEAQGAGLGLAIARELADRMHGRLTVRSIPGATTFSLDLPV